MKDDPYSRLTGLDQRLFESADKPPTQQANKPASLSSTKERSKPGDRESSKKASKEDAKPSTRAPSLPAAQEAGREAMRPAAAPLRGHDRRSVRMTGRFTYDIYQDQARWMNRLKIDLDETYGAKLTINSMVALAVDALIE